MRDVWAVTRMEERHKLGVPPIGNNDEGRRRDVEGKPVPI
jgi:hypothetical protein